MTTPGRRAFITRIITTAACLLVVGSIIYFMHWWNNVWTPQAQITKYRIEDASGGTAHQKNLILGSSTAKRIPARHTACGLWLNRGIGNGTIRDLALYVSKAPTRKWESILLYTGDNDIAFGRSVEKALEETQLLVEELQRKFSPQVILLLPIKLAPARAKFDNRFRRFNSELQVLAEDTPNVEVLTHSLAFEQGSSSSYAEDGIHLSESGYEHLLRSLEKKC